MPWELIYAVALAGHPCSRRKGTRSTWVVMLPPRATRAVGSSRAVFCPWLLRRHVQDALNWLSTISSCSTTLYSINPSVSRDSDPQDESQSLSVPEHFQAHCEAITVPASCDSCNLQRPADSSEPALFQAIGQGRRHQSRGAGQGRLLRLPRTKRRLRCLQGTASATASHV